MKHGMSRTVFLVGPFAMKVASLRNGWRFFIKGVLGNLLEAERWNGHPALARVYWCGLGGLVLVARRHGPVVGRRLSQEELRSLPVLNVDNNGHNVAYTRTGQFVVIDYGEGENYVVG